MRSCSSRAVALFVITVAAASALGCGRVPSPLNPARQGSLGTPSRGVLTGAANLLANDSMHWLRQNDRHWGVPRFVKSIERAAATVAKARPGAVLAVGDLSAPRGGQLLPHLSHRNGRDADLLLYAMTLDGAPVESPGFVGFDADGIAWDARQSRYLRFDVEREWLLVRALLADDDARIQFVFISEVLEAVLIEWARARGDDAEIILRAQEVMLQPHPGGVHDDHIHIRTACTYDEIVQGCDPSGPERSWMHAAAREHDRTEDLVVSLFRPITLPTLVTKD